MLKPNLWGDLQEKRAQLKIAVDRHRGTERSFLEGQKVMGKTVRQEKIPWVQRKIIQKNSRVTYLVSILGKTRFCHAVHLRQLNMEEEEEETVVPIVNPISPAPIPIQKEFSENSNTPIARPKDSPHEPEDQRLPELRFPPKQGETMKSLLSEDQARP